jgi:predicted DNA-binding transcriptional regulator AlpA
MMRDEIDTFVPEREVRRELGNITPMTLWRWTKAADFPPLVKIGTRNFRSRKQLEAFKAKIISEALGRSAVPSQDAQCSDAELAKV